MDRFRRRDDEDDEQRPPARREPLRDPKEEDSGGRRFPFSGRGDKDKAKDASRDASSGRRFPTGGGDRGKESDEKSGGRLGRFVPSLGKKDDEPAQPARRPFVGSDSGSRPRSPGTPGDRSGAAGPFGERRAQPSGLPDRDRPDAARPGVPGARPGALGDRPGGLPSGPGRPNPNSYADRERSDPGDSSARPRSSLGFGDRDRERSEGQSSGSPFSSRSGSRPGSPGAPGDRSGASRSPFLDRDRERPPSSGSARPGGLSDRPSGGGLPGASGRSSPFTSSPDRDRPPGGARPVVPERGKSQGKPGQKKDEGRKGRLPFLGGKKDKGTSKGKGGESPARPAGVFDRGGSARPSTALPSGAPGRSASPAEQGPPRAARPEAAPRRPSTTSRARAQAKALPDGRKAPRIVNRGMDLDRKLDLIGVALVVLGGIMLFGMLPSMSLGLLPPVEGGLTGTINHFMSQVFGWGKIAWPVLCFGVGIWLMLRYFGGQMFDIDYFRVVGALVLYAGGLAWLHMLDLVNDPAPTVEAFKPISYDLAVKVGEGGGWFGHQIYFFLLSQLGDWGTLVSLIGWLVLGVMLTFDVSVVEIGQFFVGAYATLRSRGDRAQRRAARQIAKAESVAVMRPGEQPATTGPRQIPLPAGASAGPAGVATGGSGAPSTANQDAERPRPFIRRRSTDEDADAGADDKAPAATPSEAPVRPSAPASDAAPETAAPERRRLPHLRGWRSSQRAEESDEAEATESAAGKAEDDAATGSRRGRFGFLKRRGAEAGPDGDEAERADGVEEGKERRIRPSVSGTLAAAAAGALALGAADRDRTAPDADDEEEDETGQAAQPARAPASPRPVLGERRPSERTSPFARPSALEDEGDEDEEEVEDELDGDEDEVAETPARTSPLAAPARSQGDGEEASEPYRPFSRPLPGQRRPPFQPGRPGEPPRVVEPAGRAGEEGGEPGETPGEAAPARTDQPPVRDRAQALGLPARPGMPPRRIPTVVETPGATDDDDEEVDHPAGDAAPVRARDDNPPQMPTRSAPFSVAAGLDDDAPDAVVDDTNAPGAGSEPPARSAFVGGDARPRGLFANRAATGSVSPTRPANPAGNGERDAGEDEDDAPPARPVGSGLPLERRLPRFQPESGAPPASPVKLTPGEPEDMDADEPDESPAAAETPTVRAEAEPPGIEDESQATEAVADEPEDDGEETPTVAASAASADAPTRPQVSGPTPRTAPPEPARRVLPTGRPSVTRREEPASVGAAPARDLTRRDAVSRGALKDRDESPAPAARSGARKTRWDIPDFHDLLKEGREQRVNDEVLLDKARLIEDTLESFGAPGKVVEVNPGPVITQFGVEPDYLVSRSGKRTRVKVSSIARLDADLALALAARSIRVEAPVPGKGFVGIEVPNDEITTVNLYDVMDSPEFRRINSKLRIALGLSVDGTPVAADLTVMPHLLIAGTTGSGKSVCVNAIINCLLLTNSPDELQFIMVDPKRVELTGYNGVPHLFSPVVVELERVVGVLQWIQREMDDRYRRFASAGARNILDYNARLKLDEKRMPYIVVVIDELADLMMLAPDETEKLLARLAQMARATGIHLVISTQRPSVDVVTGLIKANFPARISFAVASMMDSRVILDQPGAEKLLGRGDMLYQSPDAPAPLRMQGVYVSDEEINKIARYWKTQGLDKSGAKDDAEAANFPKVGGNGGRASRPAGNGGQPAQQVLWNDGSIFDVDDDAGGDGRDEMYDEAVELVKRLNKASISLLQRRLRIGYTRAARLIDIMEQEGIVGPSESGSKPREVLRRD